ncbi:MAG: Flp pilus assembly protein CpaB [Gemmatimonadota bacterium]
MRRPRIWIALLLAAVSGVAAGVLALNFFSNRPSLMPTAAVASTAHVAVAARDLDVGSVVGPADVRIVDWPGDAVPQNYARSQEEVVGRGLITKVQTGEPLLLSKLADKAAGGGLPIIIPEGMRAVSVKVNEVIGVAGFVLPGTRVDVLVTLNPQQDQDQAITRVILQNVQVLTAGQIIQRNAEGTPQTVPLVTLLVTPHEAEQLTLAATEGQIQLALRNTLDTEEVDTQGAKVNSLVTFGVQRPKTAPSRIRRTPAPPTHVERVEVYNGAERTVQSF